MKKNKILAGISALVMGATMMAGTAMSASADTCCIYPLALKNGSTTEVSMVQKAFVGNAAVWDSSAETLTIDVNAFYINMYIASGYGYLTEMKLYKDLTNNGFTSDDIVYTVGTVQDDLSETSPSTIVFTGVDAELYDKLQDKIFDAYVSYDMEIISGWVTHNNSEADFTLHDVFVTYPNNNVSLVQPKSHI